MAPAPGDQPVRVWLGTGGPFAPGDRVRVYVQTDVDGYLVVLHRRPDGGVEVLFPGDPATDPFARAGTYEIRGPQDASALTVAGPLRRGTVLAALSPDPFRFAEFVRGGAWNAIALTVSWASSGAEASLTDIVQRMLGDGSFNYDLVTYTVAPQAAYGLEDTTTAPVTTAACVACSYVQFNTVVEELPFALLPRLHHRPTTPAAAPPPAPATPALALYRGGRLNTVAPPPSNPAPERRRATPVVRTLPPIVIVQRPTRARAPVAVPVPPARVAPRRRDAGSVGAVAGPLLMARATAAVPGPVVVRTMPLGATRARTLAVPRAASAATGARAGAFGAAGWHR